MEISLIRKEIFKIIIATNRLIIMVLPGNPLTLPASAVIENFLVTGAMIVSVVTKSVQDPERGIMTVLKPKEMTLMIVVTLERGKTT
jgi:hypothetical protein